MEHRREAISEALHEATVEELEAELEARREEEAQTRVARDIREGWLARNPNITS